MQLALFHCPRFDSWAGMALARASRIQDKLNSNELKSDGPIWRHATPVLNCFRRALEIDSSNLSLWIEYGTMSYALHSFASRQLKQWRAELPPELVQQVRRVLQRACHSLSGWAVQGPCLSSFSLPRLSGTCELFPAVINIFISWSLST